MQASSKRQQNKIVLHERTIGVIIFFAFSSFPRDPIEADDGVYMAHDFNRDSNGY